MTERKCDWFEVCGRMAAKGRPLCGMHQIRMLRGTSMSTPPQPRQPRTGECSECGKTPIRARGLCRSCYEKLILNLA